MNIMKLAIILGHMAVVTTGFPSPKNGIKPLVKASLNSTGEDFFVAGNNVLKGHHKDFLGD